MSTTPIDYAALAKQAGAVSSTPAPTVDYAALAKQAGAISSSPPGTQETPAQKEIRELDLPGTHKAIHEPPLKGYPVPVPGAISGAVAKLIAPSETVIPGGMGFGGAAATTELGPSALSALASKATQSLGSLAAKYGIKALGAGAGGAVAYELYHELKKIFE